MLLELVAHLEGVVQLRYKFLFLGSEAVGVGGSTVGKLMSRIS